MRQSMTGFASAQGTTGSIGWSWELRGVNGKGLDLRLRLPDGIDGLEQEVRKRAAGVLQRGNVQIGLKLQPQADTGTLRLDAAQLAAVLGAMTEIEAQAMQAGLSLAPSTAADLVAVRGVMTAEAEAQDPQTLRADLLAGFDSALAGFVEMRQQEGTALLAVLMRQVSEIETLVAAAEGALAARSDAQAARMRSQLARVLENTDGLDEARIAQELAMIAVKADITEELDRLGAHVAAARDLLNAPGAIGRKLDFLMQEFNREANTLCSKSGDADLTRIGLDLKTVIDQMREQTQNVE